MLTTILRFVRTLLAFRDILRANELAGRALGLAQKTPRGAAEGWVVSVEARQEAVAALAVVYQYVYFGWRRNDSSDT